jgi:hypothetical protein
MQRVGRKCQAAGQALEFETPVVLVADRRQCAARRKHALYSNHESDRYAGQSRPASGRATGARMLREQPVAAKQQRRSTQRRDKREQLLDRDQHRRKQTASAAAGCSLGNEYSWRSQGPVARWWGVCRC